MINFSKSSGMEQEEIMSNNNRKHEIAEPLTLFDLFGSLSSIIETGKEKFINIQILVPSFVDDHLAGYEIGKPILNLSGCETSYDIGDEKSVRISILSAKRSDDGDILFEGVSDDDYNVRIYIYSRTNNKPFKLLRFV